jgi:hypothetical protein
VKLYFIKFPYGQLQEKGTKRMESGLSTEGQLIIGPCLRSVY